MATVRSDRFPSLFIGAYGVQFRDGVAVVDDPRILAALRQFTHLGVEVPDVQELPEAPKRNASRQAWADHADALGLVYPDDATRADIIALVQS